jgi:hypothetical protein
MISTAASSAARNAWTSNFSSIVRPLSSVVCRPSSNHSFLYPFATQQVEIDLDEEVKVNYYKFGKALKYVRGLSA